MKLPGKLRFRRDAEPNRGTKIEGCGKTLSRSGYRSVHLETRCEFRLLCAEPSWVLDSIECQGDIRVTALAMKIAVND